MFASAERQSTDTSVVYAAAWCRRTSPGWVMVNLDGGGKMFLYLRTPKFQLTARQPMNSLNQAAVQSEIENINHWTVRGRSRLRSIKNLAILPIMMAVFCLLVGEPVRATAGQQTDLTGVWQCDDGGHYYIRQFGPEIFWFGEQSPMHPEWTNVAHGKFYGEGRIRLSWADVPKGGAISGGILILQTENGDSFTAVSKSGGFGGSNWMRVH
jgi:hypothetical protein